jgi:hypothetical protein
MLHRTDRVAAPCRGGMKSAPPSESLFVTRRSGPYLRRSRVAATCVFPDRGRARRPHLPTRASARSHKTEAMIRPEPRAASQRIPVRGPASRDRPARSSERWAALLDWAGTKRIDRPGRHSRQTIRPPSSRPRRRCREGRRRCHLPARAASRDQRAVHLNAQQPHLTTTTSSSPARSDSVPPRRDLRAAPPRDTAPPPPQLTPRATPNLSRRKLLTLRTPP